MKQAITVEKSCMDRYAVMGNPIAHSRSPEIHARFAAQTGQRLSYERILVAAGDFAPAVARFRAAGGCGLNVTVPFKREACALADRLTERAERAGAVNTLWWETDGLIGDNTDGAGLVRDLTANNGVPIAGRRLLILGAGGAVRGILPSLLEERPERLTIANRTLVKAMALADGDTIIACPYAELAGTRFEIVANATSAGLAGDLPPLPDDLLAAGAICYDLVYAERTTAFVRWARTHGAALAVDGLGMLVEQAAESFHRWRAIRPDSAPVIAALRPYHG